MSTRGCWSAVVGVAVALGLAVPVVASAAPAGAAETTFNETCADVYGHRAIGDLDKTTDPSAGSPVSSGQEVGVRLRWPTFAVAGPRAHRVLECLSIDGHAPQVAADRQFTTAEGTVTLSEVVPTGLASGSTVCGQSFLKTQGSFGPVTRWSEKTCYPVGAAGAFHALSRSPSPPSASPPPTSTKAPDNRSTPTTRPWRWSSPPSGSGEYKAPWPPWEQAPRVQVNSPPVVSTPTTTAPKAAPAPHKAAGTQAAAPATPQTTRAPSQTLPRTGAGLVVLLAVAAVALFSGRTLRKASDRIAENLPVPAVPIDDEEEPTLVLGRRW